MTIPRWLLPALAALIVAAGAVVGVREATASRDGRLLLLDPRTGKTLREQAFPGGWVVAAILHDGRIAVGDVDSCPDGRGGEITIWTPGLKRKLSHQSGLPCLVARLDPGTLRQRFGDGSSGLGPIWGQLQVTVPLGRGKIVERIEEHDGGYWPTRLTAYDENGEVIWRRSVRGHHLGVVDARDGQVILPVPGDYTPGTD